MKKLWERLSKYERIILPLIFINVVVIIVYLFFKPGKIKLENINVANRTDVKITENIIVNFNKSFSNTFFSSCTFTINPKTEFTIEHGSSQITLAVTPYFIHDTQYILNITCEDIEEIIGFRTKSYEDASEEELAIIQTDKDKAVADDLKQLFEEFPWREELPIETSEFVITYAQSLNTFLIENKTDSPNSSLESDVRIELDKIEAPSDISITWR